ncbi:MAG: hypothetical protein AB8G11_10140 [Saprospiraceae bacterium]
MVTKITQLFIIICLLCNIEAIAQKSSSKTGEEYTIEETYQPDEKKIEASPSSITTSLFDSKFIENDNFVHLEWKTSKNNGAFIIEHSIDDEIYNEVGTTEAIGFEDGHYVFEAREFEPGINFYRLKQEIGGNYIYSEVQAVTVSKKDDVHILKLKDDGDRKKIQLRVREKQQVVIQLFDEEGNLEKELFNQVMDINEIIFRTISKDDYEPGTYFVLIKGESFKQSKKIELP